MHAAINVTYPPPCVLTVSRGCLLICVQRSRQLTFFSAKGNPVVGEKVQLFKRKQGAANVVGILDVAASLYCEIMDAYCTCRVCV